MTFAIDYDNTISADPTTFKALMQLLHKQYHVVYVVTYRSDIGDNSDMAWLQELPEVTDVIFTGLTAKHKHCANRGIDIDVWIDDNPIAISHSFNTIDWFYPDHEELVYYNKTKKESNV